MDRKELVRWGIPAVGFISYVKWGGVSLALAFALILLAVLSALIRWHAKDPSGFFRGMRVWAVLLGVIPAVGLTLGALATSPVLVVPALVLLAGAIWLVMWINRYAVSPPLTRTPSTAAQNLDAANALTRKLAERNRRTLARGAQLHTQADNLELIRQKADLEAQNAALEREAALPPDPFADPLPPVRN